MEFHEIANVFPLMEGDEFKELVTDIKKNGQQQPILTYEGKILDGRNRYRACVEAGEEPWVEAWSGSSPVEAVISLNLHRRHLSSGQRSLIAERMLPHLQAEAKKRQGRRTDLATDNISQRIEQGSEANERKSISEAAKLTGTNRQYVQDAKKLRQEAPEMAERVERGETTIPQAKRELGWTKPPEKSEPTVGELMEQAGVSMDDMPRRSEEEKALYPTWQAILKVGSPMTERLAESIPEAKQIRELEADARTARDRLTALLEGLQRKNKDRLRAVE